MLIPNRMSLPALLRQRAERYPDKTFLYWEDEETSYRELDDGSNGVAQGLLRAGIGQGDKVGVMLTNRPDYILALFAILKAGAVVVPINPALKGDEVTYIVHHARMVALITEVRLEPLLKVVRPACPGLSAIYLLGGEASGTRPFEELREAPRQPPEVEVRPEDEASLIYTSGTTGRPKGVILTHWNYVFNAYQLVERAQIGVNDRFVCILPLFHVNAQVVTTLAPLYMGASMVLLPGFSPQAFLPALERYRATAFSAVPTVYAILNSLADAERYDLGCLRFCICGAAPMPVEVFQEFERKYKAHILEGYGLSEGTCASSANLPPPGKRKVGSIGLPLIGQAMRVVDEADQEVGVGHVGEIVIKGENVMRGYYGDADATAEALRGGWLHTGDLGARDEDGFFTIVGRKKEMLIRGGENIFPKEIEEVLYRHPAVLEAAVVGRKDAVWGEEVVAVLALRPGASLGAEEVMAYCKDHLADYKCPREVVFLGSLPKTATGKIQKHEILRRLG